MSLHGCADCSTSYAVGLEACPNCGCRERVEEGRAVRGSRLPFVDVACSTAGCRAEGVVRRIHKPMIVPGVVEQTAYACVPCGLVMQPVGGWPAPGLEENMPKITRHGGASNAAAGSAEDAARPSSEIGEGEQPSVGSSSETSSERPPSSPETSGTDRPKPAPKTGSRSKRARGASSTAGSTDGSGEADAS